MKGSACFGDCDIQPFCTTPSIGFIAGHWTSSPRSNFPLQKKNCLIIGRHGRRGQIPFRFIIDSLFNRSRVELTAYFCYRDSLIALKAFSDWFTFYITVTFIILPTQPCLFPLSYREQISDRHPTSRYDYERLCQRQCLKPWAASQWQHDSRPCRGFQVESWSGTNVEGWRHHGCRES